MLWQYAKKNLRIEWQRTAVFINKKGICIFMDIFLDSKIISDKKLSSNAIAAYTALRMMQNINTINIM